MRPHPLEHRPCTRREQTRSHTPAEGLGGRAIPCCHCVLGQHVTDGGGGLFEHTGPEPQTAIRVEPRPSGDWCEAASGQFRKTAAFGAHGQVSCHVVKRRDRLPGRLVAGPDLQTKRPLPYGGPEVRRREDRRDPRSESEPLEAGRGEHKTAVVARSQPREPRVDIAADRLHIEVGPSGLELEHPPDARRAHAGAGRQRGKRVAGPAHQHVERRGPRRHAGDLEPRHGGGGHVLEAVDSDIDPVVEQGPFQLPHEDTVAAEHSHRQVAPGVAAGGDRLHNDVTTKPPEPVDDLTGLGDRQAAASGSDAKGGAHG